VVLKTWF